MKEKPTKKAISNLSGEQQTEIDRLAALSDADIDTSEMPEQRDWSAARRGLFYRPIKQQITLRIDVDLIDWFRRHRTGDEGYQTGINRALREYIEARQRADR